VVCLTGNKIILTKNAQHYLMILFLRQQKVLSSSETIDPIKANLSRGRDCKAVNLRRSSPGLLMASI
jgi:hypothetical protein